LYTLLLSVRWRRPSRVPRLPQDGRRGVCMRKTAAREGKAILVPVDQNVKPPVRPHVSSNGDRLSLPPGTGCPLRVLRPPFFAFCRREVVVSRKTALLFTELPRRGLLGNWASRSRQFGRNCRDLEAFFANRDGESGVDSGDGGVHLVDLKDLWLRLASAGARCCRLLCTELRSKRKALLKAQGSDFCEPSDPRVCKAG
jgi:hypothetical protein